MKIKKILLVFLFLPIISLSSTVKVPISVVYSGISKIFPIEKEKLGGKLTISNPSLAIYNNKFLIKTDYVIDTLFKDFSGTMLFESDTRFDNNTSDIYLSNVKLIELTDRGETYVPTEKFATNTLVQAMYKMAESKSIYNTNENKLTNLLPIKNILIENDGLHIEF